MSDLELAKSKLIDTIGHYNATASNIQKFKFNQLETNVFATMMVEFAKELANEVNKETEKALAINGVSKFDMEKFKEYVNTYDKRKNGLDNDDTIVKDMLYGIGLCLDKEEYCFAGGYKKFKAFLKAFL